MHIVQKLKRPVVAAVVAFGFAAGAAVANDSCYTCPAPAPVQPVYYAPPAPVAVCNPCAGFGGSSVGMNAQPMYPQYQAQNQTQTVNVQQTGIQQGQYQPQMQLQVPSQSRNTGINFLIPSANSGMVESATYNPPMNEVDSYYSSHYPYYRR